MSNWSKGFWASELQRGGGPVCSSADVLLLLSEMKLPFPCLFFELAGRAYC